MQQPINQTSFTGPLPKVGIRPTIDGCPGGVRASLEGQTMRLAHAADLISASLHSPDGRPVQCVIADTTIGGAAEAAACVHKS